MKTIKTSNGYQLLDDNNNLIASYPPLEGVDEFETLPPAEDNIENTAIEMLKREGYWSHLFINGNLPNKPYPKQFDRELHCVILGLIKAKQETMFGFEDLDKVRLWCSGDYMPNIKSLDELAKHLTKTKEWEFVPGKDENGNLIKVNGKYKGTWELKTK